jgi:hypothetical protein
MLRRRSISTLFEKSYQENLTAEKQCEGLRYIDAVGGR